MIKRYEGGGRYHEVIVCNNMIFLSGQTATEVGDDIVQQSTRTLEKIEELLIKYGSDKDHILHADVYVRDQSNVAAFNAVWDAWINSETAPTRACMVCNLGRAPILVEVVVTAVLKDQQ